MSFSLKKEVFDILKGKKKANPKPKFKPKRKEIKRKLAEKTLKKERRSLEKKKIIKPVAARKKTAIRQIKKGLEKKKLTELMTAKKKIVVRTVKIKDVMVSDVKTLSDRDTIGAAANLFFSEGIDGAPVISGKRLVGVVNKSDILKILGKNEIDIKDIKALESTTVKEVMHKPVTIKDDNTLGQAVRLMNSTNAERLFVFSRKGSLAGIITRTDLMRGIMKLFFDVMQKEIGATIETDIDRILNMVTTKVSIGKIAKETGMKEDHVEELAKILEEHGLVKLDYPAIGKPVLRRV